MEIQQVNDERRGHFKALEEDIRAGVMTYSWGGPSKMIIEHTEVNPDFEGKGLGKKLVMAAVEYARAQHVKILPLCSFAKAYFEKTPEVQDVLF